MVSKDSSNVKADGFPRGEDDMAKKLKRNEKLTTQETVEPVTMFEAVAIIEAPVPREDEARPCTLCESRRPIGTSYSRVYCTKANVRYCKCTYCGHTWAQERK
jgi:hypothetical protein